MYNCGHFLSPQFSLVVIVIAGFLGFKWLGKKSRLDVVIFFCVLIAGLANALEKLFSGCVWDPFDFFGLFSFNLQDLVISFGALTLIVRVLYERNNT